MKVYLFFIALAVVSMGINGALAAEEPVPCKVVSEITDIDGTKTKVTDLSFLIEGRRNKRVNNLVLVEGETELRIDLGLIAGVERVDKKNWMITLINGRSMTGSLKMRGDIEYLVGKAIIGDVRVDYKLGLDNIKSVLQVYPPIPNIPSSRMGEE
ncbi:MAG: hypothetical protein P9M00_13720 [Candidatus Tritonobacter lacicola]|nr:hypothetical protein [Candidatus Tritonobacter lacicola]